MPEPKSRKALLWRLGVPSFCVVSTGIYLAVSALVRADLGSLSYLASILRDFPRGREPLYLLIFVASCLLTGALSARLLRPWCPSGPPFCLFTLTAAIVPPQTIALVRWPDGRGAIRSEGLLMWGLAINGILALSAFFGKAPSGAPAPDLSRKWGWGAVYLPMTAGLYALVAISASGNPVGADALAYHLPLPASWLQSGSLTTGTGVQFHYPEGAGLLLRWVLANWSDRFVFVVPFACGVLTLYMLYAIGREVGLSREVAAVCACCAGTCPVFANLSASAYSETLGCLCIVLAVFFLLRWSHSAEQPPWPFLVCIGLSVGMAAATRYSMLTPGIVIVGCSLALFFTRAGSTRSRLLAVAVVGLAAFAGGGYWYARNLSQFGNPVYPLAILGLPGVPMQSYGAGTFLTLSTWWLYPWREYPVANAFDRGLGAIFGALCIPALVLFPFLFQSWRKQGTAATVPPGLLYLVVLASGALNALMENLEPRHTLAPILLSFVLVGFLWVRADSRFFRAATFLPFAATAFLVGGTFFTNIVYQSNLPRREGAERFELPKAIDEIMPATILNAGPQFYTYGLMGKDYRHTVVSLLGEATPADAVKYHAGYLLIPATGVPKFKTALNLALVAEVKTAAGEQLTLWRILPKER